MQVAKWGVNRWRERETRSTPPKASDGDGERHSTRNPLIKPIQPENNEKQRKKERSEAAMAIGGDNGDWRKLAEERLMRGRKID